MGIGKERGGHQRDRLGRRGEKKIKTISLFSCRFPTVALPEPEGYPFARSFAFDLPCLQVALIQRFRFIHSLGRSLPRSPALLVLCVCVRYCISLSHPVGHLFFYLSSTTFNLSLSLFPSSLPLTHPNLPNLPYPISIPPSFPPTPSQKKEVVKNVPEIFAYLNILSSDFFFLIPTSLPHFLLRPQSTSQQRAQGPSQLSFLQGFPFSLFNPSAASIGSSK